MREYVLTWKCIFTYRTSVIPNRMPRHTRVPQRSVRGAAKFGITPFLLMFYYLRCHQIVIYNELRVPQFFFKDLEQWFSTFFVWRHIFQKNLLATQFQHKILWLLRIGDKFIGLLHQNEISNFFGDTQDKTRDTQMCRYTLFEKHWPGGCHVP